MKKSKGIVVLLLTLILTVFFCFTAAVGIGPTGTGAAKHINTGLDLAVVSALPTRLRRAIRQAKRCQIRSTSFRSV